jgi:integrase
LFAFDGWSKVAWLRTVLIKECQVVTLGEYAVTELQKRQLRPRSISSYLETVRNLGLWDTPVEELSVQFLFQKLLTIINVNSRRKHTIALKSILKAYPWTSELRIPKPRHKLYELPGELELRIAIWQSPYRVQGLLMMYAGLRPSEAAAVQSYDVQGRILTVNKQRHEKTGQLSEAKTVGDVVLPQWLADEVKDMPKRLVLPAALRESIKYYGQKVGLHITPGLLRHWYATKLVENRINPEIARQQLRHSDIKTTLNFYVQVRQSDIAKVIDDLF